MSKKIILALSAALAIALCAAVLAACGGHPHALTAHAAQAAGCTEAGNSAYWACETCGKYFADAEGNTEIEEGSWVLEATGHTFADTWSFDEAAHWHAATCGHDEAAEREPHTFDGEMCTVCEYRADSTEGLTFLPSDDGQSYVVAGIGTAEGADIVIPAQYRELPVTGIVDSAFQGNAAIESVFIPNSVTNLGWYAFADCTALQSVTMGSGVTLVGAAAFGGCTSLREVALGENVATLGANAFEGCTALQNISLPASLARIETYVFRDCTSLERIAIPDGVAVLRDMLFYNCDLLESVTLGSGVQKIGTVAFDYCLSLTALELPASVTEIAQHAFNYCDGLENVTFAQAEGWTAGKTPVDAAALADPAQAAVLLTETYLGSTWTRG